MGIILIGDGFVLDGFCGEDRYIGFENKIFLVGVSFYGFVGFLILVIIIEFFFGFDSLLFVLFENFLKFVFGELYNLLDFCFIFGLFIFKCGDFGDKVFGEDDMFE